VPIPGSPLGATLAYLIDSTAGPVLIDAGWDDPGSWQALVAGLKSAGAAVTDLYGVLVTHHHRDHLGLATRIREESGAWIALHPADAEVLRRQGDQAAVTVEHRLTRLAAAGVPADELDVLRAQASRLAPPAPFVPDRAVIDGELADVPGRRLRALWTPGHSPGHTCFYLEAERKLLSGDHLLPSITPHIGLIDGDQGDPLGDYLASLERLSTLDVAEVLPAHEHRFTASARRAREIAVHHDARLAEVVQALTPAGATLWEVAEKMDWNQPWGEMAPASHRLALWEAAAHLRHLERRQQVRVLQTDWPIRYELSATAKEDLGEPQLHGRGTRVP
jgi:glyoxylase-like metal-dependent hydrolase (beta-lactamase superfamily II)